MVFYYLYNSFMFPCNVHLTVFLHWIGHLNVLKVLIEKNADVNAKDLGGETPLHLASMKGLVIKIIVLFICGSFNQSKSIVPT